MAPEGLVASVIVPDRTQAQQRLFKSKHTQSLQSQAKRPPCFEIKLRNENLGLFADIFFCQALNLDFFFFCNCTICFTYFIRLVNYLYDMIVLKVHSYILFNIS